MKPLVDMLVGCQLAASKSEAKRLISQGGVAIFHPIIRGAKTYRAYKHNGIAMARIDASMYDGSVKGKDPKEIIDIQDGTILRVGHEHVLFSVEGTPVEWEENYGIWEQMIAIRGNDSVIG
jgi:hypothetical protein